MISSQLVLQTKNFFVKKKKEILSPCYSGIMRAKNSPLSQYVLPSRVVSTTWLRLRSMTQCILSQKTPTIRVNILSCSLNDVRLD